MVIRHFQGLIHHFRRSFHHFHGPFHHFRTLFRHFRIPPNKKPPPKRGFTQSHSVLFLDLIDRDEHFNVAVEVLEACRQETAEFAVEVQLHFLIGSDFNL